jgi:hypothetical protein
MGMGAWFKEIWRDRVANDLLLSLCLPYFSLSLEYFYFSFFLSYLSFFPLHPLTFPPCTLVP